MEIVVVALLGLLFWPSQQHPVTGATAGDRVRVASTQGQWTYGIVRAAWGDSVSIARNDRDVGLRGYDTRATRVQVSRGQATRTRRGMRIGLAAGAVVGVGLGLAVEAGGCNSGCTFSDEEAAAILGIAGAVAGLGVGALVGSSLHRELWADVRTSPRSLSLTMPPQRVGIGLRWALPPVR